MENQNEILQLQTRVLILEQQARDAKKELDKFDIKHIAAMCLQGMLANQYSYQYEPKELHERAIAHATELLNQLNK